MHAFVNVSALMLMQVVVDFVYTGMLALTIENVEEVLSAATHLQVQIAVELCSKYLEMAISVDNCVDILNLAELYTLSSMSARARQFILENFEVSESAEVFTVVKWSSHKVKLVWKLFGWLSIMFYLILLFFIGSFTKTSSWTSFFVMYTKLILFPTGRFLITQLYSSWSNPDNIIMRLGRSIAGVRFWMTSPKLKLNNKMESCILINPCCSIKFSLLPSIKVEIIPWTTI